MSKPPHGIVPCHDEERLKLINRTSLCSVSHHTERITAPPQGETIVEKGRKEVMYAAPHELLANETL